MPHSVCGVQPKFDLQGPVSRNCPGLHEAVQAALSHQMVVQHAVTEWHPLSTQASRPAI
jgi:hypothetical protein